MVAETSGKFGIKYFNLNDKFYEMVSKITEIKRSQIFSVLWKKSSEKLKEEVVTMEMIFNVWSTTCGELKCINQHFLDGVIQLKKIDKYLVIFGYDYDALKEEFMQLSKYFLGTADLDEVKKKFSSKIEKVKSYKKLVDARQAAQAILDLRDELGLEGDFSRIEQVDYTSFLLI